MIKQVGKTVIKPKHLAMCHCGTVVLELDLPDGIVDPRRCDCSICRRKGAVVASVPLSGIKITARIQTNTATMFGCLEAVNPFEIENVPTNDGINHPADRSAS